MKKPYRRCVMGGTFDRLHRAHESLLYTAAMMAEEVFVGVVSEELGKKLFKNKDHADMIQSYDTRAAAVIKYTSKFCDKLQVEALYDPWGPAPMDIRADVIVVSFETRESAHKINKMRRENGLDILDVIIIPWSYDEDGELISSSRLRATESDT